MASPSELSLGCKTHSYSMLLKSFGDQNDKAQQRLEEYLAHLEEERLKIDAFKRELPICMQLLTNALEASRQQLQAYRENQGEKPVLEEFIPLKNQSSDISEKTPHNSDKANWMTSAQLWSQATDQETKPESTTTLSPKDTEIGFNADPKFALDTKQRNGGAFFPFSKERNSCPSPTLRPSLPDLALNCADKVFQDKKCESGISCPKVTALSEQEKGNSPEGQTNSNATTNSVPTSTTQPHRKARRCWSPDLHRRFVNALQMLGGAQVATPKQIRELMKVDGLTNDEVKSHLQKYRLHTRRPGPSPQAAGSHAPQLVVLGGIWVPPEYAAAATHGGATTIYGAHPPHATPHYCASPVPQEFYTASQAMTHQQLLHHHHQQQLQVYKAASASPECDVRVAGERSESIEDGKSSESGSWKVESNGEGGERKGMVDIRKEDIGDHACNGNGSEITLKF